MSLLVGKDFFPDCMYIPKCAFLTLSHNFPQEPVKKKGRTAAPAKVKEEISNVLIKNKTKKQGTTKKETPAEDTRCVFFLIQGDIDVIIYI